MTTEELLSKLLFSIPQAKAFHWQTTSFGKHDALAKYYEEIDSVLDDLVECYQATNGKIKIFKSEAYEYGEDRIVPYFEELLKTVKSCDCFTDSELLNLLDEIAAVIRKVLFRFTLVNA